jgi:RimJ/RimL family protein N-acetyltransferase
MRTARLDIEPTDHGHVDGLIAALDHPSVGDYIGGPDVTTAAALHERIDGLRAGPPAHFAEDHWLNFVIRRRDDGLIVGRLEATLYDGWGEVAYLVGPPFQGNGYATEGVRWLIDHIADRWGIGELWATVDPRNAASIRLLDRVGFRLQTEPARMPGSYDEGDLVYRLGRPTQPSS